MLENPAPCSLSFSSPKTYSSKERSSPYSPLPWTPHPNHIWVVHWNIRTTCKSLDYLPHSKISYYLFSLHSFSQCGLFHNCPYCELLCGFTFFHLIVKQFVVTNCSKERPGSIVNETLKKRILMLREHQKNHIFMLILNIQVSSNLIFVIKSYEPEKICLILENRGKHPLKVREY